MSLQVPHLFNKSAAYSCIKTTTVDVMQHLINVLDAVEYYQGCLMGL